MMFEREKPKKKFSFQGRDMGNGMARHISGTFKNLSYDAH
jgi:hypothetical protein